MFCLLFSLILFSGITSGNALPYDYSATIECLKIPHKPQYNGGIIVNPELSDGLKGWSALGDAKVEHRQVEGNRFIAAHNRTQSYHSVSQEIYLHEKKLYTFSAWLQVSEGSALVTAIFKTKNGFKKAGAVFAESNCWSMLKGGVVVDASGPALLYFESNNTSVEILIDSVSLQPFTEKEWRSHQTQTIERTRKSKVRVQVIDKEGNPKPNTTITIEKKKVGFPFGCTINSNILNNPAYQTWFTPRFTFTTFENEMKWYSTEQTQGKEDYSTADALLQFSHKNGIAVRGHNVFWNDPNSQPKWVSSLSPADLDKAVRARANSVMTRYKGQLIAWDVVNENLHYSFFESKLGKTASGFLYNLASQADGATPLFLNEYNTIEDSRDGSANPAKYIAKLKEIQAFPGNSNLKFGIGLESHFVGAPNLPYMRSSIDTLAALNFPVWLTEVDVKSDPNQAQYLEQILREGHSHPKVAGIEVWSAWSPKGCYRMCLTDNNFKNLATGDVVDKLLKEWGGGFSSVLTTDANGFFEASLFHGDYDVKINSDHSHHHSDHFLVHQRLKVEPTTDDNAAPKTLLLRLIE